MLLTVTEDMDGKERRRKMVGVTKMMLMVASYMTVVLRAKHYGLPDMVNPLIYKLHLLTMVWALRELTPSPAHPER